MQSYTKMKAMQEGYWVAHVPWGQGKVAASPATITYLGPLATDSEKKEQDLHSRFPSLLLQMQMLRFSDCFYAFPCFITANICRRHLLKPGFSLHPLVLCCLCFSICVVCRNDKDVSLLTLPAEVKPDRFDLKPSLLYCCHCNKPTFFLRVFITDAYQINLAYLCRGE